jgi:hypothetical protein
MLQQLVKFSPSYSLIIFSSLALTPYLLVAEETLVGQNVGVLVLIMIQSQPHQGLNQLLLNQKSQLHREIIQFLLSQI